ncbi:MAG: response regulator transcription factor [Nitrospira sp.]|jgi:DNA-binding NarL/FixJ family response regulator|nr:response regulator transcription factor [Nitrospira sp.]
MTRIRILLADDHPQICELLRVLLEPEFQVVGSVADGETLLQYAHALQPDVIISDIDMPKVTGLEALPLLKYVAPHAHVIFLTGHGNPADIAAAYAAGAEGYLIKGKTNDLHGSLRTAIQNIHPHASRANLNAMQAPMSHPPVGGHLER